MSDILNIRNSRLDNSPVAYIADLLEEYLQGRCTKLELKNTFTARTNEAQFFFFHMPQAEVQHNQQIFQPEFRLADSVGRLIKHSSSMTDEDFTGKLHQCAREYLDGLADLPAQEE